MNKKIITDKSLTPLEVFKNTKTYCPLLWCHLHVNTYGDVQPCCMSPFGKGFGNLNNQDFDDIWNGSDMKEARKKLINDEPLENCKGCYEKEKSSEWSLRKASITQYHDHVRDYLETTSDDGSSYDSKPIYWDIRFSNICNMRCRMCGHFSSSKWFADAKKLNEDYGNNTYFSHKRDHAIIKGVKNSNKLLSRLDEYLPYVKEIYFAGGEPMLMDEHYQILKRLDELKLYDTYIRYNTNLLQLYYKDKSIIELWKKFNDVFCSISVDSYGKRAELIRKDTDWKTIEKNIKDIKNIVPHVKVNISPTVQILNIFTVTDLHKDWIKNGFVGPDDMFLNILHTPRFYCIKNLPRTLKELAKEKLTEHIIWLENNFDENVDKTVSSIKNSINFMMSEEPKEEDLYRLVEETAQLDSIRNENTLETFPELKYIWNRYNIKDLK
jgi:MoaA/NifB/PqqE/SkfB family radical SAM enzyme